MLLYSAGVLAVHSEVYMSTLILRDMTLELVGVVTQAIVTRAVQGGKPVHSLRWRAMPARLSVREELEHVAYSSGIVRAVLATLAPSEGVSNVAPRPYRRFW